jgi:hypothetical protein
VAVQFTWGGSSVCRAFVASLVFRWDLACEEEDLLFFAMIDDVNLTAVKRDW